MIPTSRFSTESVRRRKSAQRTIVTTSGALAASVLIVQAALGEPVEDGLRDDAPASNHERICPILHLETL
jgi:hypothetical protein